MDGSNSFRNSIGSHKRRSPPPPTRQLSPSPPSLSGSPYPNGTASALSLSSRSANSRSSVSSLANPPLLYGTTMVMDEPVMRDDGESSSAVDASPGIGAYAYSTTLRRQPSIESGYPPSLQRSTSPHLGSPYRKRVASSSYGNGRPFELTGDEERGLGVGMLDKAMGIVRKAMGRSGYERIAPTEEDRHTSAKRRARETPSAIYAHKSIEV